MAMPCHCSSPSLLSTVHSPLNLPASDRLISCGDPLSIVFAPYFWYWVSSIVGSPRTRATPRSPPLYIAGEALAATVVPLGSSLHCLVLQLMLAITVQMDLSSLEGPPMLDNTFSSPALSTHSVPHIRLEDVTSPVSPLDSNSWDLPPRPASTSAIPPRSKYPNISSNGFWQSMHPDSSSASNHVTTAPRSHPAEPSSHAASYRPSTASNLNTHTNTSVGLSTAISSPQPTRSIARPHSSSLSTPHQLVWVESEQIWILTTRTTPSTLTPPHHLHPHYRSHPSLAPAPNPSFATRTGAPSTLSHSRSMELNSSTSITEFWGDINDPEDLPPPYEQHIFDRPLGPILPAVRRVPREEVQQIRESRWSAVGRRVT
ncbi:hypothetical protein ASPCAL02441 [Aspergillus calidoustus]|uniref:Uncharacterized protein n=1 Tax=Aspergillus calidoustus TaxID=454130 RepID=A0A0U5GPU8_ASPCI|nr:hypothetical protein ASPCAL02441 [Aspergillus calidoustus]